MVNALTIGHLAKETGVNLETVRYYERRGLLPKPPRSALVIDCSRQKPHDD